MYWFQRNRVRILASSMLLISVCVFFSQIKQERDVNWWDKIWIWLTSPVQESLIWLMDGVSNTWTNYLNLRGAQEENSQLKKQLEQVQRQVEHLIEVREENKRLRNLVKRRKELSLSENRLLTGKVIGISTSPVSRMIRVDVGSQDGVRTGDAVISATGLVGRVTGTTGQYSQVQLIVDGRSAVDVVIQRSRARGILRGQGDDQLCPIDNLVRTSDVVIGDKVVTSGLGGAYPSGLKVGNVVRVTSPKAGVFREAHVQPTVAFDTLEEVLVILAAPPSLPLRK